MDDVIYTGQVEAAGLLPLIKSIQWNDALMMLERIPTEWLGKEESEKGICFESFDDTRDFKAWQSGRIFDAQKELCWFWLKNTLFHVIYAGVKINLPSLQQVQTEHWECSKPVEYLLWGKSLKAKANDEQPLFFELQIPRLLCYPISCKQEQSRLAIKVLEYRDKITGHIQHYRFVTLEEKR